jgi:membrane protein implicated in regulation of membrane protease activity
MEWWVWVLVGLVLVLAEALFGGELWLLLVGCAAIAVGAVTGLGVDSFALQLLGFSVLGAGVFLVKRQLRLAGDPTRVGSEELAGETGRVTSAIGSRESGVAEFRGARWTARSAQGTPVEVGANVRVVRVEGVTLWVETED